MKWATLIGIGIVAAAGAGYCAGVPATQNDPTTQPIVDRDSFERASGDFGNGFEEAYHPSDAILPSGLLLSGTVGTQQILFHLTYDATRARGEYPLPDGIHTIELVGTHDAEKGTFTFDVSGSFREKLGSLVMSMNPDTRECIGEYQPIKADAPVKVALQPIAEQRLLQESQLPLWQAQCAYWQWINPGKAWQSLNKKEHDIARRRVDSFISDCPADRTIYNAFYAWTLNSRQLVTFHSNNLVSFVQLDYVAAGGVHGYWDIHSRTYSIRSRDTTLLNLSDVMRIDHQHWRKFEALVAEMFNKQGRLFDHFGNKWFTPLPSNFGVTPLGIAIHIPQGTMAAECEGTVNVLVPFTDLHGILLEHGVLGKMLASQ